MFSSDIRASVIIPTLNRKSFLPQVLDPVLSDPATAEVVLVVDGDDDGTFEFLTELSRSESRIHPVYQQNSGENAARSRGASEANHEIAIFLDDDVVASPGLITAHCLKHPPGSRRLVLGYMPTMIPTPRQPDQVATHLYAQDYEYACRLFEADPDAIFTQFWAGNISMRRDVAMEVFAQLPKRLIAHGDLQFGLRCRQAGLQPMFDRSLLATHHHRRSLEKFVAQARRSGEGRAQLGREFPDLAAELSPAGFLSLQQRVVARSISHPWVHDVLASLIMSVCHLFGRHELWRLETFFARILRVIELVYGFERPRTA